MGGEILFERKGSTLRVNDGTGKFMVAKVPDDQSILSILGTNPMFNGGDYKEDGWIYVDGKKVRKWFIRIGEGGYVRIWEPKLANIPALENSYTRCWDRLSKFWEKEYLPATKALQEVKQAHAKPTHKCDSCDGFTWWLYKHWGDKEADYGFSFDWVEAPEKPLNHEIGQKLYEVSRKHDQLARHCSRFREALNIAIERFLEAKVAKESEKTVDMLINGRHYVYVCSWINRYYMKFQRLAWPRDKHETITMK